MKEIRRTRPSQALYILGAGGHGQVVAEIATSVPYFSNIHFLDDVYPSSTERQGHLIVGSLSDWPQFVGRDSYFVVALGDNAMRRVLYDGLASAGGNLATLISSKAMVSQSCFVDVGAVVMHGAVVNTGARIGPNAIVNSGAIVEHHSVVGAHAHLAPGSTVTGGSRIGLMTTIGAGAVVCPGVKVGDDILVGAGAVVTHDLVIQGRYFGVPARRVT